jgi:hypothetical protein
MKITRNTAFPTDCTDCLLQQEHPQRILQAMAVCRLLNNRSMVAFTNGTAVTVNLYNYSTRCMHQQQLSVILYWLVCS